MKHLLLEPDFDAFRHAAREHLRAGFSPAQLDLQDATVPTPLTLALEADEPLSGPAYDHPHVPKAFLEAAQVAAVHRDPQRWNLLYRLLYRLQSDRNLLRLETDDDVAHLLRLEGQVRRDLHKMHAFVRFRKVLEPGDPSARPIVVDEELAVPTAAAHDHHEHHLVLETHTPFGPRPQRNRSLRAPHPSRHHAPGLRALHRLVPARSPHRPPCRPVLRRALRHHALVHPHPRRQRSLGPCRQTTHLRPWPPPRVRPRRRRTREPLAQLLRQHL